MNSNLKQQLEKEQEATGLKLQFIDKITADYEKGKKAVEEINSTTLLSEDEKKALRSELGIYENGTQKVQSPAIVRSPEAKATIKDAQSILKENFVSKEEAMSVYKIKKHKEIPFNATILDLERAQAFGMHMIPELLYNGKPVDLALMAKLLKGQKCHDKNHLLYYDQFDLDKGEIKKGAWFLTDKKVLKENTLTLCYRLAKKKELDDSPNKKFIPELRILTDSLVNGWYISRKMPKFAKDAIKEFEANEKRLTELEDSDWEKCTKESLKLSLPKLFMENAAETLNRLVLWEKLRKEKLLPNMYTRNNTGSSDGGVLDSGWFASDAPGVRWWRPDEAGSGIGLVLSFALK